MADITAVDVEDDAIRTAARNISLNNMSERIRLIHGSIKEAGRGYDFIAANIFQEVLLNLMPDIAAALNKDGKVAVSGLLTGQEEQVIKAAKASGLEVVELVPAVWLGQCVVTELIFSGSAGASSTGPPVSVVGGAACAAEPVLLLKPGCGGAGKSSTGRLYSLV